MIRMSNSIAAPRTAAHARRHRCGALAALAALIGVTPAPSRAYDTGSLSCEMIGDLAAQTLAAKQGGRAQAATLAVLTAPLAEDARVERRLVGNIVETIYRNDLLVAMKPADAYRVYLRDCLTGKQLDEKR
jgi:hypothetical protein